MEINRNQWFLAGLVLVFFGLQFRLIDSVVLTPQFTTFLAEQTGHPTAAASKTIQTLVKAETVLPPKKIHPPDWLGWSLLSMGAVLVLHSLSLKRPG